MPASDPDPANEPVAVAELTAAPAAAPRVAAAPPCVRVRLFAGLREQFGWSDRRLSAGATPLRVWQQLASPDNEANTTLALPVGVRVAINKQFAAADTRLNEGDELAFLPAISGG